MKAITTLFKKEITWHFLFWFSYLMFKVLIVHAFPGDFWLRLSIDLSQLPLKILVTYTFIYILIEKLLVGQRYLLFFLALPVIHFSAMFLNKCEDLAIAYFLFDVTNNELYFHFFEHGLFLWSVSHFYPIILIAVMCYILKRWYENAIMARTLSEAMTKAELNFLKEQLHPHFLFNTLNNIYSLSLTQPSRVPDVVLKLSELLSYMLYDSNNKVIPLKSELQSIRDYMELEKLRLGERLELSYTIDGNAEGKMIAPMILLPFIENCFKHAPKTFSEKILISVFISITQDQLVAQIENSKSTTDQNTESKASGIGLSNVRKRLEILYPGAHELTIFNEDTFLVKLQLRLNA